MILDDIEVVPDLLLEGGEVTLYVSDAILLEIVAGFDDKLAKGFEKIFYLLLSGFSEC